MLKEQVFELWGRLAMDHMGQEVGAGLLRLYHWIPQFDPVCAGETQFLLLLLTQGSSSLSSWMLFA